MTVGVLHRVETLADRSEAEALPPPTAGAVSSLVPLPEMLGEIAASGPASKTVERSYGRLLRRSAPSSTSCSRCRSRTSRAADSSLLAEAVARLRAGNVIREAGYDGEYGVIRLFEDDELRRRTAGGMLFERRRRIRRPLSGRVRSRVRAGRSLRRHLRDLPTPDPTPHARAEPQPAQGQAKQSASLRRPRRPSMPISARRRRWSRGRC